MTKRSVSARRIYPCMLLTSGRHRDAQKPKERNGREQAWIGGRGLARPACSARSLAGGGSPINTAARRDAAHAKLLPATHQDPCSSPTASSEHVWRCGREALAVAR
ncbi:hypothetical protein SETIT_6G095300v2 [Setaria italica]|uniref:Uncharacterized protein n=1 Tax=Setaria italica TaxID=4555 RepID=A0A368RJR2_SETIT|nr:hypothetical protein SETIT_6G095300v2 [Setaria italica]